MVLLKYTRELSPCSPVESCFAFKEQSLRGGSTFRSHSVCFSLSVCAPLLLPVLSASLCSLPALVIFTRHLTGLYIVHSVPPPLLFSLIVGCTSSSFCSRHFGRCHTSPFFSIAQTIFNFQLVYPTSKLS